MSAARDEVALFVTCLVDLMRPNVGFAAVELLRRAGCTVYVPPQGCCGQPNYNSGDRGGARRLVLSLVRVFKAFPAVVAPSGSCASMLKTHAPALFEAGSQERLQVEALGAKTHELTTYLAQHGQGKPVSLNPPIRATYHDACSGLRELNVKSQPRRLLQEIRGLQLVEMADSEACCGFGGTFCVKYPDISDRMVEQKTAEIASTGAQLVLCGDVGCLINIEGKLHRAGLAIRARHVAEALLGFPDEPP